MTGLLYLVAVILFIYGIKRMGVVRSSRNANRLSAVGMLLAIIGVLLATGAVQWWVLILGLLVGSGIGALVAKRIPMTAMPEMVAALNGSGGFASALVALVYLLRESQHRTPQSFVDALDVATVPLTILIGWITLTGSLTAYLKLQGKKVVHPLQGAQRHLLHAGLLVMMLALCAWLMWAESGAQVAIAAVLLSVLAASTGVLVVMPIGGADMPIVISLLNSYSGIAGALSGFVVGNPLLIVAGALVGSSGVILSQIMCKAMNRSLGNVLIGGIGDDAGATTGSSEYSGVKSTTPEEVATIFDGAQSCIIVPGYGLAVAQAQHTLRELQTLLEKRGCAVRYAIHPVAGRMPGHMNVLLAEADVPYDKLVEMDAINGDFKSTDVVVVVGANDVVNPAARAATGPIAGMPILNVDEARTVLVIKRSLAPGYAGIKNPLFERDNCLMVFQDAKQGLQSIVNEVKALSA